PEVECIGKGKASAPYEIPWAVDGDPISARVGCYPTHSGVENASDQTAARAGRPPHRSWRDLCFDGTVSFDLGDHRLGAGRRGDVCEALLPGGRRRQVSGAFCAV